MQELGSNGVQSDDGRLGVFDDFDVEHSSTGELDKDSCQAAFGHS